MIRAMASQNHPTVLIANPRTHQTLADCAVAARSYFSRMKGLLGTEKLETGEGLVIERCNAIHTFFMRMKIDVIFVDRDGQVVRYFAEAPTYRLFWGGWKARAVLELPAGTIRRTGTQLGDLLECRPKLS